MPLLQWFFHFHFLAFHFQGSAWRETSQCERVTVHGRDDGWKW